ncbi:MAG TPA: hypothetical protein VKV95_14485 [Terriglobia bacterium]|nr:hypothetical protein [Terriglobia bacterium]
MKIISAAQKWASIVLGVICLALLLNLALRSGVGSGTEKSPLAPVKSAVKLQITPKPGAAQDDLSRYDPEVKLDLLSDLQSRELPQIERNPFEFERPKPIPPSIGPQLPGRGSALPPPPVLSIKLIGYSQKESGLKEGIIADEDGLYVVHEGETFAKRYKVTKLTSTFIEIYDETTRQTVSLPIAP